MRSERAKMVAGEPYDPADAELSQLRRRARRICRELNASDEEATDLRRRLLGELFAAGGEGATVEPPFFCDYGFNISLGQGVYFNTNCVVLDVCPVEIGERSMFGPAVQIYAATHPLNAESRRKYELGRPIVVGSDVWCGGGAILCPGVTIGSRTVIGAGSVVTRDIPSDVFAAGNPCRVIREIER
jgi:maltose O-acetyltransferase